MTLDNHHGYCIGLATPKICQHLKIDTSDPSAIQETAELDDIEKLSLSFCLHNLLDLQGITNDETEYTI